MMNLAALVLGRSPARFSYRGQSPLIVGELVRVEAYAEGDGLSLRVVKPGGPVTMVGRAV